MVADRNFDRLKCNLGPDALETDISWKFKILGLPRDFDHEDLGIKAGHLQFSRGQMASLFDPHIKAICNALDEQLEQMNRKDTALDRTLDYMILSGGLGSSKYLYNRLEQ